MNMPIKFCSEAYFFRLEGSLMSLKSQTRDLQLKVPSGGLVLRSFTSIHGLNPRTLDLEESTLPRDRQGRQDNVRTDLKEIGINTTNWVDVAQDMDYWRVLVNATLNPRLHKPWS